jgi:hypothetical protein
VAASSVRVHLVFQPGPDYGPQKTQRPVSERPEQEANRSLGPLSLRPAPWALVR